MAGIARSSPETQIPWLLTSDLDLVIFVDDAGKKSIKCLSQVACDVTRASGVTELTIVDHDMAQKLDASKLVVMK